MRLCLLLVVALLGHALPAAAHEVRPAYLQIREAGPYIYDIMWKTPAQGNMRLALNVILPRNCHDTRPSRTIASNDAVTQFSHVACKQGLPGQSIAIENLATSLTDVIIRFEPLSGSAKTLNVTGETPEFTLPVHQSKIAVARTYFGLGVKHILTGYDHLLFLLCLMVLAGNMRRIIGAVTAFTLAHSITLAATTMGWVHLASAPVEASIALSIMFLAAEVVKQREGAVSLATQWPWIASFCFGLLHGFGFASALRAVGLPDDAIPLALLCFNLGVEAGQLAFIFVIGVLAAVIGNRLPRLAQISLRAVPLAAGTLAAFWFIERSLTMIG